MDEMTIEQWRDPEAPGRQVLKLAGTLTIGQAQQLKETLLDSLADASELSLDLSGVTEIDLTGLQLLCACHQSAQGRGKRYDIADGGNQVFLETVVNAGFQRQVGCTRDGDGSCIWLGGEC